MAMTMPLLRRKQPQQPLISLYLPFDLVKEILCRLPVKQLIQLCCVCKSWNTLISHDSKFAKKHLRLSTSRQDRHHLIRGTLRDSPEFFLCHSPISSIFSSASTTQFKYPLKEILNRGDYYRETSACDGILCIRIDDSFVLLCNPSIRKLKILSPLQSPQYGRFSFTLVYDRFTNNYKVIAINIGCSKLEVLVHTLGTDYWTRIQDFPGTDLIIYSRLGTSVNDTVNWLARASGFRAPFTLSLDLEKESYQKFSLPVFDVQFTTSLMTLRGCLSLLCQRDTVSDVWIMKEYGNDKSWTKFLTVPHLKQSCFHGYTKALYFSKDGQVLMESLQNCKFNLVVYNSINNTFKIPKFENKMVAQAVYVESLISPF